MRDVNRIEPFLTELGEIWKKYPDLRFGQLMFNLFANYGDPFYLEEDEFLVALKAHLNGENPRKAVHQYLEEQVGKQKNAKSSDLDRNLEAGTGVPKGSENLSSE